MTAPYLLPSDDKLIPLQLGDVVCCEGSMGFVSAAIRWVERVRSKDNEATYGHSFLVMADSGSILDPVWTVRGDHISQYRGQKVIVARPMTNLHKQPISPALKQIAVDAMWRDRQGKWYPVHRLVLHLLSDVLAKYASTGKMLVCSETVAKYLAVISARGEVYAGITPDDLADEWRRWKNFDVIYEGLL